MYNYDPCKLEELIVGVFSILYDRPLGLTCQSTHILFVKMRLDVYEDSSSSYDSDGIVSSDESSLGSAGKVLPVRTASKESARTKEETSDGSSSVYSSSSSEVSGFDSSEDDTESSGSDESSVELDFQGSGSGADLNASDNSLELLVPSTKTEILPNDTPQMNDSLSKIPSLLDNERGDSDDEEDLLNSIPEHMPTLVSDEEDGFDTESSSNHSDSSPVKESIPRRRQVSRVAPPKLLEDSLSEDSDSSISFNDPIPMAHAKPQSRNDDTSSHSSEQPFADPDSSDSSDGDPVAETPLVSERKNEEKQAEEKKPPARDREVPPVANLVINEKLAAKQAARAARMEKVRARIAREKKEKEEEEAKKKKKKKEEVAKLDSSENARRERAYSWYTRSAMPKRDDFKERVRAMPLSSGITEEDVDLLPWNSRGTMVNVAKMNSFLFKR